MVHPLPYHISDYVIKYFLKINAICVKWTVLLQHARKPFNPYLSDPALCLPFSSPASLTFLIKHWGAKFIRSLNLSCIIQNNISVFEDCDLIKLICSDILCLFPLDMPNFHLFLLFKTLSPFCWKFILSTVKIYFEHVPFILQAVLNKCFYWSFFDSWCLEVLWQNKNFQLLPNINIVQKKMIVYAGKCLPPFYFRCFSLVVSRRI